MPFLIDGNNLLFALKKAGIETGRLGLCALLSGMAKAGERIAVVFDGPPPAATEGLDRLNVEVEFAAPDSADEIIRERIAENSAPRRLVVVSTDKEVRKAARHRRCQICLSEDFAQILAQTDETPRPKRLGEPAGKRHGVSEEEALQWLNEFQVGEGDPACDDLK